MDCGLRNCGSIRASRNFSNNRAGVKYPGPPMSTLINMKIALIILLLLHASVAFCAEAPQAATTEKSFSFGKVVRGAKVEHAFVISNEGTAPLRVEQVRMTSPLRMERPPAVIAPKQSTVIPFVLDTSKIRGEFEGLILLTVNDPVRPEIELGFTGKVVEAVEISPVSTFVLAVTRGEARETSLEIINHEPQPLRILAVEHSNERFTTRLQTVEDGQRYKLSLMLNPKGPAGEHLDTVVVRTSSAAFPELKIKAMTWLKERVHTFPDVVDMGTLRMRDIQASPALLTQLAQTLMVYQVNGTQFEVSVRTDIPGLDLTAERGPKGDRYQITLTLLKDKITSGPIKGNIFIETNDPEFPSLTVPVTGFILSEPG